MLLADHADDEIRRVLLLAFVPAAVGVTDACFLISDPKACATASLVLEIRLSGSRT
jgi:hypothetical protein